MEQTYSRVAVKDGQIVGVIMGNSSHQYSVIKHLHYLLMTLFYQIIMLLWRYQGFHRLEEKVFHTQDGIDIDVYLYGLNLQYE